MCCTTLSLVHGNGVISGIRALLKLFDGGLVLNGTFQTTIRFTTGISNGVVPGTKATCGKGHKLNRAKSERFQIVSWFSCPRQFLFLLRSSRAKSPSSRPFSGFLAFKQRSSSHCAVFDCKLGPPRQKAITGLRHNEAKHCKSLIHPKGVSIHELNPTHSLVTDSKSNPNVVASQPRTETQQFLK